MIKVYDLLLGAHHFGGFVTLRPYARISTFYICIHCHSVKHQLGMSAE